jgi:hypothetical protein
VWTILLREQKSLAQTAREVKGEEIAEVSWLHRWKCSNSPSIREMLLEETTIVN